MIARRRIGKQEIGHSFFEIVDCMVFRHFRAVNCFASAWYP